MGSLSCSCTSGYVEWSAINGCRDKNECTEVATYFLKAESQIPNKIMRSMDIHTYVTGRPQLPRPLSRPRHCCCTGFRGGWGSGLKYFCLARIFFSVSVQNFYHSRSRTENCWPYVHSHRLWKECSKRQKFWTLNLKNIVLCVVMYVKVNMFLSWWIDETCFTFINIQQYNIIASYVIKEKHC